MPTEFFEKDGKVSLEWLGQPAYEMIHSTYQYFGGNLDPEKMVDYLVDGRKDISQIEISQLVSFDELLKHGQVYNGNISTRLLKVTDPRAEGIAKLIATYQDMPNYKRGVFQLITISEKVASARFVHLLMHEIVNMFNEPIQEFMEDDTPNHISLDYVKEMISKYKEEKGRYDIRLLPN